MGAVPRPAPDTYRKSWAGAPPGFFAVEAAGLRWLAEAAAVRGTRVVAVHDVGETHIDLDRLVTGRRDGPRRREARPVARPAARRRARPPSAPRRRAGTGDAWIGRQTQSNDPTPTWGAFYAEQRVRPFVRRAVDAGTSTSRGPGSSSGSATGSRAGEFDDGRPPARIHGDLWAGNVVFTDRGAVLIDPAAHGGHGLTDLAMLALFGVPGSTGSVTPTPRWPGSRWPGGR